MYDKLAKILVDYSIGVKENDIVLMTGDIAARAVLEPVYRLLMERKAHVMLSLSDGMFEELFYQYANDAQLQKTPPLLKYASEVCQKRIKIIGSNNTRALSHVDPKKKTIAQQALQPILQQTMQRSAAGELEWILSLCPTNAGAQEANMGFYDYEQFVFKAGMLDHSDPVASWKKLEKAQALMIQYLEQRKELLFKASGTELLVNVENMVWKNSCGKRNFPDGEVFTGPNLHAKDGGINGIVSYTYPAILNQTIVEGIVLEFENGKVVNAKAQKNESFLKAMIAQDQGSNTLGEIAIGTNYGIKQFTHNILFDEKIGGTFHAALGAGYPETKNTNQSALHWDMICDLTVDGKIYADGELISDQGVFLDPKWPKVDLFS